MQQTLDQLLPSLQAFGVGAYWVLMLAAFAEGVIFVGIIVPGSLVVVAGGLLVRAGTIDFFELAWFVAAGAIIGAEISFRLGRAGASGLEGRSQVRGAIYVTRAKDMLARYGGFGMVIARFIGPIAAFVPFASAMADMPHRKFTFWNIVSAVPYALILPAFGYFLGDILAWLGAAGWTDRFGDDHCFDHLWCHGVFHQPHKTQFAHAHQSSNTRQRPVYWVQSRSELRRKMATPR